ncbi:QueT transporter family protein [Candidatus Bathyarchaeota archaeon]|nr:QueT transporter family protein [Candidatus Bathyarchaeota archaeon]
MGRTNAINSAVSALFAAIYAIGVITLAPISFMPFQVRIADSLMPLAILFGWPAIIGLTLGCLVANFFGGLGYIDVIGGSIANMIAGFIAWKISQRRFQGSWLLATVIENLIVTVIVGSYLWFILAIPDMMVNGIVVSGLLVSWGGIFMGSLVSINVLGYALLKILTRSSIVGLLKSRGLRIYVEE